MDRDDARFVVHALDSRISGDRETLDQLAWSSVVQLVGTAARVRALAAGWQPALEGAAELEAIARHGAKVLDAPRAAGNLIILVDKLRQLIDEPPVRPLNRQERRRMISRRSMGRPYVGSRAAVQ